MKDHYRTLGVPDNASELEIKFAYRKLAKRYHPDVNAGAKGAEERFKEITEAYSILSDFILRSAYDTSRMRPAIYYPEPKQAKKDPGKKDYSEQDMEWARARHKKRLQANMTRRKKILTGMIVTFIVFMTASGIFDRWIEQQRELESKEFAARLDSMMKIKQEYAKTNIESMDSPFDSLFGSGVHDSESKNKLYIYMPFSDAVICAMQSEPPYRTIRNEFIRAQMGFVMNEVPDGKYFIKLYTGKRWDVNKKTPDGRKLGGFTKDELFLKVRIKPIRMQNFKTNKGPANVEDTITLHPSSLKFDTITREEFFYQGE